MSAFDSCATLPPLSLMTATDAMVEASVVEAASAVEDGNMRNNSAVYVCL